MLIATSQYAPRTTAQLDLHGNLRGTIMSHILYDNKLPFWASKSPEVFHRLTQSVTRMMARRGFNTILAYLDDFLIIGDSKHECELAYCKLIPLLSELGFGINWEKAVAPSQRLTFLGIEIDTVLRQLCLPERKLCELRELLSDTLLK